MRNAAFLTTLRSSLALIALVVLQLTVLQYVSIGGATPDVVLIGICAIALRHGQEQATVFGFSAGLVTDLFVGDLIGISALAKTISGFIAGYYFEDEKSRAIVRSWRFLKIVAVSAAVHNVIYLLAYIRSVEFDFWSLFLLQVVGATAFTSLATTLYLVVATRLQQKIKM